MKKRTSIYDMKEHDFNRVAIYFENQDEKQDSEGIIDDDD